MPGISHHPSCPMGCPSRAPHSARSPGPAASPASVRVMVTSNSQTTEDCSLTPALSSLAHPRALRADSSDPLPSCPTKWPRYSSAFFLQCSAVHHRRSIVPSEHCKPRGGRPVWQLGFISSNATHPGSPSDHPPVFSVEAGQLEGDSEAVVVPHRWQQVEASALEGHSSIRVLRPRAAPAWHRAEQLSYPLQHGGAGARRVMLKRSSVVPTDRQQQGGHQYTELSWHLKREENQADRRGSEQAPTCCSVSRSSPPITTSFMRSALYCSLHQAVQCGQHAVHCKL